MDPVEVIKTVPLENYTVRGLIDALEQCPDDASITTDGDEPISGLTLIWDMGDWVLLTVDRD